MSSSELSGSTSDTSTTLKVASLGSGSRGNATVVSDGTTTVLVDCGFSVKEALLRLERFGLQGDQLSAIIVTHEHSDHISGVGALSRRFNLPVYATHGTFLSEKLGKITQKHVIRGFKAFSIEQLLIQPIPVPHDAREPCQFVFSKCDKKLGVLTDLGSITDEIVESVSGCHGMLLEFNHDSLMLEEGPYPIGLKARVGGNLGHLSNPQALDLLEKIDCENLSWLVASHISEKNNCSQLVEGLLDAHQPLKNCQKVMACQNEGFGWLEL